MKIGFSGIMLALRYGAAEVETALEPLSPAASLMRNARGEG